MAKKQQITTRIPPELHRKVKAKAALSGKSITEVINELLASWIEDNERDDESNRKRERLGRE